MAARSVQCCIAALWCLLIMLSCMQVGIIHTNYLDYARREEGGDLKAPAMAVVNDLVCRMHCHKVRIVCWR